MAGKNQHYIWQLIQRGFGEKKEKDVHIWVYEKGQRPRKTVTRKHGSDDYFYVDTKGETADNLITDYENSVQSYLQDVRRLPHGSKLQGDIVGPIVSHLEIRSLFIREHFSDVLNVLLREFEALLSNEANLRYILRTYIRNHPEILEEHLENLDASEEAKHMLRVFVEVNSENLVDSNLLDFLSPALKQLSSVREKVAEFARDGHIKGILKGFTETERSQTHEKLTYTLQRTSERLILPDNVLCFFTRKGITPFSQKGDYIEDTILPLSTHCYILGSSHAVTPKSHDTLLRALASCSYKSFVAEEFSDRLFRLQGRIGKNAQLISPTEIRRLITVEKILSI